MNYAQAGQPRHHQSNRMVHVEEIVFLQLHGLIAVAVAAAVAAMAEYEIDLAVGDIKDMDDFVS